MAIDSAHAMMMVRSMETPSTIAACSSAAAARRMDPVTVYRKNSISETTTTSDRTTPSVNDAPIDAPSGRSMLQPGLSAAGYDLKFGPTRNRSKPLMIPPSASVTMMTDSTGSPMKWRKTIRSRTIREPVRPRWWRGLRRLRGGSTPARRGREDHDAVGPEQRQLSLSEVEHASDFVDERKPIATSAYSAPSPIPAIEMLRNVLASTIHLPSFDGLRN